MPQPYEILESISELKLRIIGHDFAELLHHALALADAKKLAFYRIELQNLTPVSLTATIFGRPITRNGLEIKAVTYHGVHLSEAQGQLSVDIIFDI